MEHQLADTGLYSDRFYLVMLNQMSFSRSFDAILLATDHWIDIENRI